jgi:hypothetical protein
MVAAQGKRPWAFFCGTFVNKAQFRLERGRAFFHPRPSPEALSRRHRHFLKPGLAAGLLFFVPQCAVRRGLGLGREALELAAFAMLGCGLP